MNMSKINQKNFVFSLRRVQVRLKKRLATSFKQETLKICLKITFVHQRYFFKCQRRGRDVTQQCAGIFSAGSLNAPLQNIKSRKFEIKKCYFSYLYLLQFLCVAGKRLGPVRPELVKTRPNPANFQVFRVLAQSGQLVLLVRTVLSKWNSIRYARSYFTASLCIICFARVADYSRQPTPL